MAATLTAPCPRCKRVLTLTKCRHEGCYKTKCGRCRKEMNVTVSFAYGKATVTFSIDKGTLNPDLHTLFCGEDAVKGRVPHDD